MADEGTYGSLAGMLAGAAIGGPFGLAAAGLGAGLGGGFGGMLGGLFGKHGAPQVDISGELAKIRALYDQQAAALKASSKQQLGEANKLTSSNLAGRGIYSSPVSEYSFGANQKAADSDLTKALASLYGGQAQTESNLLGLLSQQANQNNLLDYQQRSQGLNQLSGALAGAGSAFLRNRNGSSGSNPSMFDYSYGPWAGPGSYGGQQSPYGGLFSNNNFMRGYP